MPQRFNKNKLYSIGGVMQSESVLDRLNNPPVIDGRKKPIDLGDMPEDMDLELAKVAIYEILEEVLSKYPDANLDSKSSRHNIAGEIFKKITNEGFVYRVIDKEPTTADEFNEEYFLENERLLIEEQKKENK
jgi:hypothetical protein